MSLIKKRLKFLPFYLASKLPFICLYFLSDIMFVAVYHLIKYRRKVVKTNLINSFPDKSPEQIKEIERRFYKHLCDLTFESIKSLSISKKEIQKRFIVENPEFLQKYHNEKRSMILYAAHMGNWELFAFLPFFTEYLVTSFYQPLSSGFFDELMLLERERNGVVCLESNKGYKSLLKFKQDNILSLNCIIGDQSPGRSSPMYWTNFMHQKTAFLIGADTISKKANQVVIFPYFTKERRGYYRLNFRLIEEFPTQIKGYGIIDGYIQLLEESIHQSPHLYLWSHRRWKLTPPAEV